MLFVLMKGGQGRYGLGNVKSGDVLIFDAEARSKLAAKNGELLFWEFTSRFEDLFPLFSAEEICLLQGIWEIFRGSKLYHSSTPLERNDLNSYL